MGKFTRNTQAMAAPIYKVGLVLVATIEGETKVCLTQVKAKNADEQSKIDFGLPKGTRRYRDARGRLLDARDWIVAHRQRDNLEPVGETLMHEAWKEIGLPAAAFGLGVLHELGSRLFASRGKHIGSGAQRDGIPPAQHYDIDWYVMEADAAMIARMHPSPEEAHRVDWFSLSEIDAMNEAGRINPCYANIAREAVDKLRNRELKPVLLAGMPVPRSI